MRIFCWNVNALVKHPLAVCLLVLGTCILSISCFHYNFCAMCVQVPTIPNFRLTHGSLKGFFDSQQADVVCFQVTDYAHTAVTLYRQSRCITWFVHAPLVI